MTWRRIGQSGLSRSIRLKKCGVTASASFVPGKQHAAAFFIRELQMLLELGERSDPILQLPFPIVPEFRRHIRPIARRMRDELFSIHFASGKSDHFVLWKEKLMALTIVSMQAP